MNKMQGKRLGRQGKTRQLTDPGKCESLDFSSRIWVTYGAFTAKHLEAICSLLSVDHITLLLIHLQGPWQFSSATIEDYIMEGKIGIQMVAGTTNHF